VQQTVVDGVPVFWRQGPEPLAAGLVFSVGRRDETFPTGEVTHLVEHLVMGALPRSHLDRNASVHLSWTEFTACGRPQAVVDFLAGVCRAIGDLPLDRLGVERGVLEAEAGELGHPTMCALLGLRYGARGMGLAGYGSPAADRLDAAVLGEHLRRHFVRGNAALWLTGPPPEGLRLPLPDGRPRPRDPEIRRRLPLPCWRPDDVPGVGLSFEGGWGEEYWSAARILTDRLTDDARHTSGMSYEVDSLALAVDQEVCHYTVWADARPGREREVAERLWTGFRALGESGPTGDELGHQVAGMREYVADPRSAEEEVATAAREHLVGRTPTTMQASVARLAAVGLGDVASALHVALDTAIVVVPEAVALDLPDLPLGPECTAGEVTGPVFRRRFRSDAPRGATLTVGDDGVTLRDGDERHTVHWSSCVGVGIDDDLRVLIGAEGCTVPVIRRDWRDGHHAIDSVDRHAPPHLRFRLPSEAAEGQ
jgi:hypothetical protein